MPAAPVIPDSLIDAYVADPEDLAVATAFTGDSRVAKQILLCLDVNRRIRERHEEFRRRDPMRYGQVNAQAWSREMARADGEVL